MKYSARIFASLVLCGLLVLPMRGRDQSPARPVEPVKSTNAAPLEPGPNDWRIALKTVQMLEEFHYLHLTMDPALAREYNYQPDLSAKFFDMYINTLDPQHIHFLQSDLAEFSQYRTNLNALTKKARDTSPAFIVYRRFLQRLEERTALAKEMLSTDPFDFTGTDKISSNRKQAPFPKDMDEARQLWRERVRYEYLQEKLNKEGQREIFSMIGSRHDPVSLGLMTHDFRSDIARLITLRYNRTLRNFKEWDSDKVLEVYLSALAHCYDPHSDYEDREDLENFAIQMSLSLFGIGAVLTTTDDGMYCKIKELNPSGPAFKSKKLHPGDRIIAVAQGTNEPVDVVDMPLDKTVQLIRGTKGTEVRLTLIPALDASAHVTISLIRDEIKLEEQQAKAKIIEMPGKNGETRRIGVVDLPSFYASFRTLGSERTSDKSATVDVARLLDKLNEEKVSGVILDLRRNGGGSLEEAINLTGLFIKEGPVVQVRSSDTNEPPRVDEDHDPSVQYDGPLIVLTSHFSASASEILAGALQDYGRALIVGDASTHGKGTVQSMTQLAPYIFYHAVGLDIKNANPLAFGALRYTTNKFYRVSGSSTQLKGVIPDIVLPSVNDYLEVGEKSLDNPLAWDEIPSANYEKLNRVQPYLAELEKRSDNRVAESRDFAYVRQDIEQVKKVMAEKIISLNEAQRLTEKAAQEVRQRAREAELKARKLPMQKIYDLTIKDDDVLMKEETNSQFAAASPNDATANIHPPGEDKKVTGNPAANHKAPTLAPNNDTPPPATDADDQEATTDDKVPQVDPDLDEAESILSDYIRLMHSEPPLTAEQKSSPKVTSDNP